MSRRNRFDKVNQPKVCRGCGRLALTELASIGPGLCRRCLDAAGLENEHQDGYHDGQPSKGCPMCHVDSAE